MAADDTGDRAGASVVLASRPGRPAPAPPAASPAIEAPAASAPPARSLTAAARRIDLTTRDGRRIITKPSERDKAIWSFIRSVPEAKFAVRFMGNALSRVTLYPGVIVDPAEAPVPVDQAVDDPEIKLPPQIAADALSEHERITAGPDGQAGLMRGFGENLTATGEAYLVGRGADEFDPVIDDEVWQVYSKSNIVAGRGQDSILLKSSPKDPGRELAPDDLLYRVWRRDTEWPDIADAGIGSVIDELEELLIYSRQFRAVGKSRNPAGILLLPSELDPPKPQRAQGAAGQTPTPDPADQTPADGWTQFETSLVRSLIAPNEDDGSAASVVPHIIKGPGSILEKVRHLLLDRTIDKEAIGRMKFLIERIAHGVDLPVEVLTGIADANHWTGWQIEDSTWKAHVEPTAQIPAIGLTAVHLRPALLGHGHDRQWVRRIVFGVDPSRLVVRPNRAADAQKAHEAIVISDEAYRGHLGFAESDAPTEEERLRRYALEKSGIGQDITAQLFNFLRLLPPEALGLDPHKPVLIPSEIAAKAGAEAAIEVSEAVPEDAPPADDATPEEGGDPTPDTEPAEPPEDDAASDTAAGLTAAGVELTGLGETLDGIETRLRDRLQVAASGEMNRALTRAGNRIRGSVQGDPEARDEVNGVPAESVGLILGTERSPVTDPEQLLVGAFEDLRGQWDAWVTDAEAAAATAVATSSTTDATPDDGSTDRDAGWTALYLGLLAYAAPRIFQAVDAEGGEADLTLSVPAGIIRDALTVAGGGQSGFAPAGLVGQVGPPGLLTGPRWRERLAAQGIRVVALTWNVGFPSAPFAPHQALAGTVFSDWQDPQLTNGGTFPATSHFYPGDHRGCQCSTGSILVQLNRQEDAA